MFLNLLENPTPKSFVKIELIESHLHSLTKDSAKTSPNHVDPSWSGLLKVTPKKCSASPIALVVNKKRKMLIRELVVDPNTITIPDDNDSPECSTLVGQKSTRLALAVSKGSDNGKKYKSLEDRIADESLDSKGKKVMR